MPKLLRRRRHKISNMRNIIIICVLLLFVLAAESCSEKSNPYIFDFELLKKAEIKLENVDRNYGYFYFVEINNSNVLIFCNYKSISFYDVDLGTKIKEIKTDKERILQSVKFINKDSIFIYYHHKEWRYDAIYAGQFQLIDINGKIKKIYHYKVDSADLKDRKLDINEIMPPSLYNSQGLLTSSNNVFFSPYSRQIGNIGTKEFIENKMPLLMFYDTEKENFYVSKQENFPYIKEGMYYPSDFNIINYSMSDKGFPLIRFFYSSVLFEWDYKNDKLIEYPLKSRLYDTIPPLQVATSSSNNIEAKYIQNCYDQYRKQHYSSIAFNNDIFGKQENGRNLYSIIIADNNFEYLGEAFCPRYSPNFFTNKDMLYIKRENDSIIGINYLKIKKQKINFDQYIDSVRKDLEKRKNCYLDFLRINSSKKGNYVVNLLKGKIKIEQNDYTVVTIYAQNGCLGCRQEVMSLISQNQELLEKNGLYLIISNNDPSVCISELKKFNLLKYKNLLIDSTGFVRKLTITDEMLNPRITIVKNNKIVLDSIYSTNDMADVFMPKLINSLGLKKTN